MLIALGITSLTVSLLVAIIVYIKLKSIYINLFNLSKGLDILWANQEKILELTKIKGYVQLVHEEEPVVRKEIVEERTKLQGFKKTEGVVRPPNSDSNNEGS